MQFTGNVEYNITQHGMDTSYRNRTVALQPQSGTKLKSLNEAFPVTRYNVSLGAIGDGYRITETCTL